MSRPRRTVRHPGSGPNLHKARVSVRLKRLGERMRDLAAELAPENWIGELRGQGGRP